MRGPLEAEGAQTPPRPLGCQGSAPARVGLELGRRQAGRVSEGSQKEDSTPTPRGQFPALISLKDQTRGERVLGWSTCALACQRSWGLVWFSLGGKNGMGAFVANFKNQI